MIRTYRNGKRLIIGLLGAMLVVAAGCQSVGGVDVSQAVGNKFKVQSGEDSLNVNIELIPRASATQEQLVGLDNIKNISLTFHAMKKQDAQHASYQGELTTIRGKVPFGIYVNGDQTIVKIEGANKPIVFNEALMLQSGAGKDSESNPMMQTLLSSVSGPLMNKSADLLPLLAGFIINHADNPKTISVTPVTESIHSESLSLNKLHSEISGTEAGSLLQKLFVNLAADEKGMHELLGSLYDVIAPEILKNKDNLSPLVVMILENKEQAVTFLFSMLQDFFNTAAQQADMKMKAGQNSSDQMYLKLDMYLDSALSTRKTVVEALLPAGQDNDRGLSAVKISLSGESWNINKPVTADTITVPGDAFQADGGGNGKLVNPSKLLSIFDKQSTAYQTLREDMQITRKRLAMTMGQDAGQDPGDSGRPFIKDGFTMVPVRYVVENLDADVKWNGEKRQVTVHDALTGNEIIFSINSQTAHLNGSPVTLGTAAIINSGGSTYVPVRFITEQGLGGKISWDDNTRTVSITRD